MTEAQQNVRDLVRAMRRDANSDWPIETGGKAPHKPLMLLAIMDLIEAGVIAENLITYDERLLATFDMYWQRCVGNRPTNPLQPFWYLKGDGFWTLVPQPGCKQALDAMTAGKVPARRSLNRLLAGAQLHAELYALMSTHEGRKDLRRDIIGHYFAGLLLGQLEQQHEVIVQSTRCATALRRRLNQELADLFAGDGALDGDFTEESRSIAFRSVVVDAYVHTCAMCGTRIRTPTGRSAVQAAHIVPFIVCKNNDPRNGMALCPLHHWAFDQGMVTVTSHFLVQLHPYANELPADVNFLSLKDRVLLLPTDERIHPASIALDWHRRHVFDQAG